MLALHPQRLTKDLFRPTKLDFKLRLSAESDYPLVIVSYDEARSLFGAGGVRMPGGGGGGGYGFDLGDLFGGQTAGGGTTTGGRLGESCCFRHLR